MSFDYLLSASARTTEHQTKPLGARFKTAERILHMAEISLPKDVADAIGSPGFKGTQKLREIH